MAYSEKDTEGSTSIDFTSEEDADNRYKGKRFHTIKSASWKRFIISECKNLTALISPTRIQIR